MDVLAPMQVSWLTPVEIFQPHYGNAIANYITQHHGQQAQQAAVLRMYEIGGGTGTLARNILVRGDTGSDQLLCTCPEVLVLLRWSCSTLQVFYCGVLQHI